MATKLTKKQKGFVKVVAITDNATEAVVQNYDVKDRIVAKSIGAENLTKPYIIEAVEKEKKTLADRIPDDLLEQVHLEGLKATKFQGVGGMVIGIGKEGVDSVGHSDLQVPDYATRHKYLDSGYKLKGSYAPEKSQALNVNVELKKEMNPEMEALRDEYKEKLRNLLTQ